MKLFLGEQGIYHECNFPVEVGWVYCIKEDKICCPSCGDCFPLLLGFPYVFYPVRGTSSVDEKGNLIKFIRIGDFSEFCDVVKNKKILKWIEC